MYLFAQSFINWVSQPWPWYVSGALIAGVMIALLFLGKSFGVSATMRAGCAVMGAGKFSDFFNFDWKSSQVWNFIFILGALLGGFIASQFMMGTEPIDIAAHTVEHVESLGFTAPQEAASSGLLPQELTETSFIFSWQGLLMIIGGGFMVGFGARYAGGCTSGHAISGLSQLQLPSLIAVIGFFIGGLAMVHFIMPLIFG